MSISHENVLDFNRENYYTTEEAAKILGKSKGVVSRLRREYGCFPGSVLIEEIPKKYYLPKVEVRAYKEQTEKYILTKMAADILHVSRDVIHGLIDDGDIRAVKENGKMYVSHEEIRAIAVKEEDKLHEINRDDYYSSSEAAMVLKMDATSLLRLRRVNCCFPSTVMTIKKGKKYYFSKAEIHAYKEQNSAIADKPDKYITTKDAAEPLGVSRSAIHNMIKEGKLQSFKEKGIIYILFEEIEPLWAKVSQVKKDYYITDYACNLLGLGESRVLALCKQGEFTHIELFGKGYIRKKEVDRYIQSRTELHIKYYTVEEVAELLEMNTSSVLHNHVRMELLLGTVFVNQKYYLPKVEVDAVKRERDELLDKDKYLTVREASEMYSISRATVQFWIAKLPNTRKLNNVFMICRKDIEDHIARLEYLARHVFIDNWQVAYNFFLNKIKTETPEPRYPQTSDLFESFVLKTLKNSKVRNFKGDVGTLVNIYGHLLGNIHKDFYLFTDNEINLFFAGLTVHTGSIIANFLKHCKAEKKSECLFNDIPVRENMYDHKKARPIVHPEIFFQYRKYVIDIEHNVPLAMQKSRYAQVWIYIAMHLFEAWRAGDIVSIPNIDVDQIGISDFAYFREHPNGLTRIQAEIILQQYYINEFIINKTGGLNAFNVPNSFVIPLATALTVAELHRRENGENCLMYHFRVYYPNKSDYLQFFRGKEELTEFSNLIICRTLMTLHYEYLSSKPNLQKLAFSLTRRLRMHKLKKKDLLLSNTPSIYVQDMNNEEKDKNLSVHIFERGAFGWLYFTLLLVIAEDIDLQHLSLEDQTQIMVGIQDKQSPLQIEGLGKSLLRQQEKRKTLMEEIRSIPKERLLDKIQALNEGIMPARMPEAQCFKYGDCPYPKSHINCPRCKYLIPNKYFLISLKNELYELLDNYDRLLVREQREIGEISISAEKLKLQGILYDYMTLLREALNVEYGLGRETVAAFIDLKDLNERLGQVR